VIPRRRLYLLGAATAVILCTAIACSDSGSRAAAERPGDSATPPGASRPLSRDTTAATQTDSLAYHVMVRDGRFYEAPAMVTFRNTSPDTAYFVNCNGATPTGIQRETAAGWVDVWNGEQDACLSAPIVVPPGDTLRRRVLLFDGFHPLPNDTTAAPSGPTHAPAVYRIIWHGLVHHYNAGLPFGTEPSIALRTSNRFLLTGAPR
jgi:hypothetical protein